LKELKYSTIKEGKEIAAISDGIQKAANSPYEMMVMNKWLIMEYGGK